VTSYRILCVGPMLGRHAGHIPSPAETLGLYLRTRGHTVLLSSAALNRYARLLEIVWAIIRQRQAVDILFIQVFSGASFVIEDFASRVGSALGYRIIMELHGGAMPLFMRRFPNWSKRVLKRAHILTTPSYYLADALENYGLNARIIPNGIDLQTSSFRQRVVPEPHLIWLRAFHRQVYNPLGAVESFELLCQEFPELTLTMVGGDKGDGSYQEIESRIRAQNLLERVRLVPGIPKREVPSELSKGGIFLNTTRFESFGISVMEAAAVGLPIVTTNVGELPFLWADGENALLVPPDDPASMARAIRRILTEPGLSSKLSYNARQNAVQYSWERTLPMWEALFAELMANETCAASAA